MIIIITVISSVVFEYLWSSAFKNLQPYGIYAVVSGIILALNVPVAVPLWIPVVGAFMIIIVKMCFGGIGQTL